MNLSNIINTMRISLTSIFKKTDPIAEEGALLNYDDISAQAEHFNNTLENAGIIYEICEGFDIERTLSAYTINFTPPNPRFGDHEVSIWIYGDGEVEFSGQILTNKQLNENYLAAKSKLHALKPNQSGKKSFDEALALTLDNYVELTKPYEVTRTVTTGNTVAEKLDYIRNYLLIPAPVAQPSYEKRFHSEHTAENLIFQHKSRISRTWKNSIL